MKKVLLSVSGLTAALALSSAAIAGPTVYGKLHVSVGSIATDDGTTDESSTAVSSHSSRLGFKGEIEGTGGVSFPYKAEYQIDPTEQGGGGLKSRDQYIGMKGDLGQVSFGRLSTPYKNSTAKVDLLSDSYIDYNNIISSDQDKRVGDSIGYKNNFGIASVALQYSTSDDSLDLGDGVEPNKASITSAAVNVDLDGSWVSVAYQAVNDGDSALKLGGGASVAGATLGFALEQITGEEKIGNVDQTNIFASVKYGISDSLNAIAQFGTASMDVDGAEDATMIALGVTHSYGKSASVYAIYGNGAEGGLGKVGGGDSSALAVGIIGKF